MKLAMLAFCFSFLAVAQVPKTWDEKQLKDWSTPIAGLGVRPGHFTEEEYYASPVDNYRTYPVYAAGRGPEGYFERLKALKPARLIEPEKLKTRAQWIAAGKQVWEGFDIGAFRMWDPTLVEEFREAKSKRIARVKPYSDGRIPGVRWIVTEKGLGLTAENCTGCHVRELTDGKFLNGPGTDDLRAFGMQGVMAEAAKVPGMSTMPLPGDDDQRGMWRSFAAPWVKGDVHEELLTMSEADLGKRFFSAMGPNQTPRWSGSIFYPTKIPDLIALKGQKFIDHSGVHRYRGTGDLMRYAALVSFADRSDFGPHQMLSDVQRKVPFHAPDELLYALALFVESLEAPVNPNPRGELSEAGQKVFAREGCAGCHSGPNYTNGKLTLASGFVPSKEMLKEYDILPVSVGTDPGLALKTRKGTGMYKIPSLRGLWYRGRYMHDGSVTTLEEMFDANRLKPEFVPSGFKGLDKNRAVPGHEFGLKLNDSERKALLAFLRTL